MKPRFTDIEIKILILIIFLTVIRGAYNIYFISESKDKNIDFIVETTEKSKFFSLFNIVQFFVSSLYLIISLYFILNNKIHNYLFGLVCFFMIFRSVSYFIVRNLSNIKFLDNIVNKSSVFYKIQRFNFIMANIVDFLIALYFLKIIFI